MARYEVREMPEDDMGWKVHDTEGKLAFCMKPGCDMAVEVRLDHAERIVACLNALSGIPDPAAFVEAARKVVEPGRSLASWTRLAAHRGVGTSFASPSDQDLLRAEAEASAAIDMLQKALSGKAVG